jgi:hypothetical protein
MFHINTVNTYNITNNAHETLNVNTNTRGREIFSTWVSSSSHPYVKIEKNKQTNKQMCREANTNIDQSPLLHPPLFQRTSTDVASYPSLRCYCHYLAINMPEKSSSFHADRL